MIKHPFNNDNTNNGIEGWWSTRGDTLIIFFKWTNSRRDWLNHLNCIPKRWRCDWVHRGWLKDLLSVDLIVSRIIGEHGQGRKIVFCGESYGGAIAKAFGRLYGRPCKVINISGPKFFCSRVMLPCELIEIRNRGDIVPFLPLGYRGARGTEYYQIVRGKWRLPWKAHADYNVDAIIEEFTCG